MRHMVVMRLSGKGFRPQSNSCGSTVVSTGVSIGADVVVFVCFVT
jgi:hypothetical protein